MKYTFRALYVTDNLEKYPQYEKDTLDFPELAEDLEDECDGFVHCVETGHFWPDEEFFAMTYIKNFYSEEMP